MSFEKRIQKRHPWVEKCFTKTANFRVQCQEPSCKEILKYVKFSEYSEFENHFRQKHLDFYQSEENEKKNKDWKYFRLTTEKKKACIICDICKTPIQFSQNENLSEHVKKHSKLERDLGCQKKEKWGWKYLEKSTDFSATCKLCTNDTKIEFTVEIKNMKEHILNKHEEKKHLIDPRYKQSWEFHIENNYWLIKCYKKPVDFITKCKFCNKEITYVDSTNAQTHMKDTHKPIYETEMWEMKAGNIAWQYLRFTDEQLNEMQCMICCKTMPNIREANSHIQDEYKHNLKSRNWAFKYARQHANNVTCTICEENVTVRANIKQLKKHADTHKKYMDKIAEENLLWGTIIRTVQWIWLEKCYINVENFRAQCKFCEHKVSYITHTQFLEHIKNEHAALHSLEEEKNAPDIFDEPQWNYIRYIDDLILDEKNLECIICGKKNELPHTNHFPHKLKFVSHWALKYARQNVKVANCTLCKNEVNFEWAPENLENHITSVHPKEREKIRQIDLVQRTVHDQATPSTSYAS
nr:PREDICTED: uncharacterized protein LOC105677877 isoform X2 [Linepithema humile]